MNASFQATGLFVDRAESYHPMGIYFSYHGLIPNVRSLYRIDQGGVKLWIRSNLKDCIITTHSIEDEFINEPPSVEIFMYMLANKLMIYQNYDYVRVYYPPGMEDEAIELVRNFKKFPKKEKKTSDISLVANSSDGLDTVDISIKKPKLSINSQYNDDLLSVHSIILKSLRKKHKGGLILLHGQPGTGKSTYIRYLIHQLSKKVIFISPKIASNLDSPGMTNLLICNQNSVFVLEDAEELLVSRNIHPQSGISMLLNMTDGLLGESLGIQIIATFNSKLQQIDPALLRKGRLISRYEFRPLDISKTKSLLNKLGKSDYLVKAPMTLAEIYNTDEKDYNNNSELNQIGFISGRTG